MHHRLRAVAVTAGLGLALAALPAHGAIADELEAAFQAQDAAAELSVEEAAAPDDENVPVSDADPRRRRSPRAGSTRRRHREPLPRRMAARAP